MKWQQSLGLLDISSSSASSSTSTGQLAESLEYDLLLGKPISSTTGGGGEGDEETLVENSVESMYNSIKVKLMCEKAWGERRTPHPFPLVSTHSLPPSHLIQFLFSQPSFLNKTVPS